MLSYHFGVCTSAGVSYLSEYDTDLLSWKLNATSSAKQTERLKSFFKFCVDQKWIEDNPASPLKPPIGNDDNVPEGIRDSSD
jgi:site-specific recombinase XerD